MEKKSVVREVPGATRGVIYQSTTGKPCGDTHIIRNELICR